MNEAARLSEPPTDPPYDGPAGGYFLLRQEQGNEGQGVIAAAEYHEAVIA